MLLILGFCILLGCVMAQLISRHPLTTETWAQTQASVLVGFVVEKVTLGQVLPQVLGCSPVSTVELLLHIHSLCITNKYITLYV